MTNSNDPKPAQPSLASVVSVDTANVTPNPASPVAALKQVSSEATIKQGSVETTLAELRAMLARARGYIAFGEYQAAHDKATEVLDELDPTNRRKTTADPVRELLRASALSVLGVVLTRMGRTDARPALESAVTIFESRRSALADSPDAQSDYGVALSLLGRFADAVREIEAAVTRGPATLEARRQLGLCLVQRGQYDAAEAWLLQVAQVQPEDEEVCRALATALERQGKTEAAAAQYRDLGTQLLRKDRVADAGPVLERSLVLRSDDAEALAAQGEVERREGRFAEAHEHLHAALRLRSDLPQALRSLAAVSYASGDFAAAAEHARSAMQLEPSAFALSFLSLSLFELGRGEEAIEALRNPIVEDYPELGRLRANLLVSAGREEEALRELDRLLKEDPGSAVTLEIKAGILLRHENHAAAIPLLQEAVAKEPTRWSAAAALIQALSDDDRFDDAIEAVDATVPIAAGAGASADHMAWFWGTKGRLLLARDAEAAVAAIERALEFNSENAGWLYELLGLALVLTDRPRDALTAAAKAAERVDDSMLVPTVEGLAYAALEEPAKAEPALRLAFERRSPIVLATTTLIQLLMESDRAQEALGIAITAGEFLGRDETLLVLHSKLLRRFERFAEAVDLLRPSADLADVGQELLEELGEAYLSLEKNEEALQIFDRVLQRFPDAAGALASRGQALLALGKLDDSINALSDALPKTGGATWVASMLVEALRQKGRYLEALPHLRTVLERPDGRQPWILGIAGIYHSDVGEFEEAARLLDQATQLDSKQAWLHTGYGWALENLGSPAAPRARDAYQRAHELDRDDPWALKGLGNALRLIGDRAEADNHYRLAIAKARRSKAPSAGTFGMIGWCHYQLGHYAEAQRLYLSALQLDAKDLGTQFDLALVLMRMGHFDLAAQEYQRGLTMLKEVERPRQHGFLLVAIADLDEAFKEDPMARDRQDMMNALADLQAAAVAPR